MITIYNVSDGRLKAGDTWLRGSWLHVEDPTEDEIERLCERAAVPRDFISSALDPREIARADAQDGARMVIVRMANEFGQSERVPYGTIPLALIVTPENFLTVCRKRVDFAADLNDSCKGDALIGHWPGRMIPAILRIVAARYLVCLEEIDDRLEDVENRLMDSIENSEMLELLRYEKSLVLIKTGLGWDVTMIDRLQGKEAFAWDDVEKEELDDALIEFRQGYQMASTFLEMLESTTDAFASLISNNLSVVMKFMAAVTIVLTVPMIIASVYGMNVPMPGNSHPLMFLFLAILSVVLSLLTALWFYRRSWLSLRRR
ncbi:MAG: hypothetical protein DCC51_12595 [Anaerolineae bacterium]|nr:MAG: hypothetical protein DCC51_12595 [Anaerolineae bacterium]